jgi:cobalt-precorrin 5A hydrolase
LPALDALICVTLRRSLPPLPVPHWKLVPQRVVAGIGCRRDTPARCSVRCWSASLPLSALTGAESDRQREPEGKRAGLRQLAHRCRVPFETFSAEALREHEHRFPASSFVRETVGVGSVSGPVAWLLSQGNLSGETLREQGVTITLGVSH